MPKRKRSVLSWRISRIRGSKSEVIGIVAAPTMDAAIEVAIIQHKITDPDKQRRLVARPERE